MDKRKPKQTVKGTDTRTLIEAMRILSQDIQSGDGVANAAIAEAADRLEELQIACDMWEMGFSQSGKVNWREIATELGNFVTMLVTKHNLTLHVMEDARRILSKYHSAVDQC